MPKTKNTKNWRGPDGKALSVGQLVDVRSAVLGPSVTGHHIVRRLTDEGIVCTPTSGDSQHLEVRVQESDIRSAGLKPA